MKDGAFVFINIILITLLLNFTGFNFGHNRIWSNLGDLGLINIFNDNQLNGFIVLGFILGIIAFIFGFAYPSKVQKKASFKEAI